MTDLLAAVPDEPRWVEARALLLAGAPVDAAGAGWVVRSPDGELAVAIGDAAPAAVAACDAAAVLCAIEREDLARALAGAGRRIERALLHVLPDPALLPDDDGAAPLQPGDDLSAVPAPLRAELERAARDRAVYAVHVDGAPVSFAYAPWRTARWFDISVDTLREARQLGLATRVAAALIRAERAGGREPVWGAAASNLASLRLAERLGFAPCDALWIAA